MTQFCTECGGALRPNVKFCTSCGALVDALAGARSAVSPRVTNNEIPSEDQAVATPAPFDGTPATSTGILPWLRTARGGIVAGALMLGVAGGVGFLVYNNQGSEAGIAAANAVSAAAGVATNPAITGQVASMFIIADANVRDRATAQGSMILRKTLRGESVSGVMQIGEDGESLWLKLSDNAGYMGATNLAAAAPPKLAKSFTDMLWNIETGTDLLAAPAEGSAVLARLEAGNQTTIAGVTENGYAEVKRTKGGVGYFLVNAANDRTGALAAAEEMRDSDIVNDASDTGDLSPSSFQAVSELIGTFAVAERGKMKEVIRVSQVNEKFYISEKTPTGTWRQLDDHLVDVSRVQFEKILGHPYPGPFQGLQNNRIAIFKVPANFREKDFVARSGYFIGVGIPIELHKL